MQGQIDINFLVKRYKEEIGEQANKIIYLEAYIEQLEKQILDDAKAKEESTTNTEDKK
ncbi:hypothetical protein [Bacillus phage vB_BanS-Thrax5]|nr:hypothetical protein [Bacillus phage vB_BanS-Thrax5]